VRVEIDSFTKLGEHILICGDSVNKDIIQRALMDTSISLVLTDPPYGVGYVENKAGFAELSNQTIIANDHQQTEQEYAVFTQRWIQPIIPYLAKKNAFYIFNSDKMIFALREGMQLSGVKFSQLLIWIKNHSIIGRMDYLPQHEFIAYGWYGTHEFHKSKDKSVILYPKPNKSKLHPTMKPVGLLRRLILNSTRIGDVVFEPFGGSGSTLIACEQTKRRCIMVEIDPTYCEVIINRFENLTGIKAERIKHA